MLFQLSVEIGSLGEKNLILLISLRQTLKPNHERILETLRVGRIKKTGLRQGSEWKKRF